MLSSEIKVYQTKTKEINIYIYIWGINKTIWFVFNKLKEKNIVEMREKKLERKREREREQEHIRVTWFGMMAYVHSIKPLVATFLFIIFLK